MQSFSNTQQAGTHIHRLGLLAAFYIQTYCVYTVLSLHMWTPASTQHKFRVRFEFKITGTEFIIVFPLDVLLCHHFWLRCDPSMWKRRRCICSGSPLKPCKTELSVCYMKILHMWEKIDVCKLTISHRLHRSILHVHPTQAILSPNACCLRWIRLTA